MALSTACHAGCARQCITPPLGVPLAGYFHERLAEYVRDDLYVRAVVVESGSERLALVSCDLIAPDRILFDRTKALIVAETGIAPECVLICTTHTHTGPEIRLDHAMPVSAEWAAELPRHIAATVAQAVASMFEATLRPGRAKAEGYAFNRLFRQRDGTEVFGRTDDEVGPAGPVDSELQTLSVVDEEGELRALLVHFALHVDVIGGGSANFISADWPGELARNIAAVHGADVITLFLQGTCGDINHNAHGPTAQPRRGVPKAVQLGRGLAGVALHAAARAEPMASAPLRSAETLLSIPYYTRDATFMAELESLRAKEELTHFERYTLERGETWSHDGEVAQVPVQVLRLGEVALVALPAEIFVRLGLEIKHFSPAPSTFVVELANADASTYVPTTDQAGRGAYGARPILSRWLCADAGRRLIDAAQVMLWELWQEIGGKHE